MRLSELQTKEIINMTTGKRLGMIIDVIISTDGTIKSLILEEQKEYKKAIDCLDEILESKPYDKKIISKKEELQGKLRDM